MASDQCCGCSVWCWAIAFSITGIFVTIMSLVGDHYVFVEYAADTMKHHHTWYGHVLSIRDYIQLGIYAAVLFNAAHYRSARIWLVLAIVQLVNCLLQFAVFILVAVVLGTHVCSTMLEPDQDDCEQETAGVLIAVLPSLPVILIYTVIIFKCWRAETSSGSAQSSAAAAPNPCSQEVGSVA
ncbi:hypothetical protein AAVH_01543 [Aphelenchoides avenae]|nr:hypothetical protein AAVH_01543 [Aphelenchus avenae]